MGNFEFPQEFDNGYRLKDFLEKEVDEKFYISQEKTDKLISQLKDKNTLMLDMCQSKREGKPREYTDFSPTLSARDYKEPRLINEVSSKVIKVGSFEKEEINDNERQRRVYSTEGISPTILARTDNAKLLMPEPKVIAERGRYVDDRKEQQFEPKKDDLTNTLTTVQNKIIKYDLKFPIETRKYEVDIEKLKFTLRHSKMDSKLTNKQISDTLNKPVTLVEHWFRQDNCFAIPDIDVWISLKDLLNIETDEFDLSVMTFVEQEGVYDKANRLYDSNGIAPALTCASADEKILENKCIQLGSLEQPGYHEFSNRVYSIDGAARTLMGGGGNLNDKAGQYLIDYRIRRLTPKECWRLMGFTDKDFQKAQDAKVSNSQLYKQAGNSIVTNVLRDIFKNLFNK